MQMNNKKHMSLNIQRLLFFLIMLLLGAIGILIYSGYTGNTNQVFTDVVNEFTAINGSNKSAEKNMFYIFSFLGIVLYAVFYFSGSRFKVEKTKQTSGKYLLTAFLISVVAYLVIYQSINWLIVAALLIAGVTYRVDGKLVVPISSFFFITIYSIIGLYRLAVMADFGYDLRFKYVIVVAFIITALLLIFRNEQIIYRGILIAQLFVPFLLLIYLESTYVINQESSVEIPVPKRILIPVAILIIVGLAEAIIRLKKNLKEQPTIQNVLGVGTCVGIMMFNQYAGQGSIMALDLHHSFEDVIGYSQIFQLGQKPFEEYIPVSGMYSVLHGLFFEVFGHGLVSFYNVATNIFYLCIIIAIVLLLRMHLQAQWVLFLSVAFYLGEYNRVVLMAPIFLLLALPKLIEKKNLWLKVWFLSSFIHGLYYPVYGAAICIGFMPLGIWQIYTYAKSGDLKKDIKSIRFWIYWAICFVPVILGAKLLIGTAKHMLAMADQTIYADGVTRFGQIVPEGFFPYIHSIIVRLVLYYQASYLVLISIVWISFALFLVNGKVCFRDKKLIMEKPIEGLLSISIGLIALVSMSYSVVRCEVGDIYSRSDGFVKLSFLIIVILVVKYMYDNNKNAIWVFAFACFLIALVSEEGFNHIEYDGKLNHCYVMPNEYVYVRGDDLVDKLGECFIPEAEYTAIENSYNNSLAMDKEQSYLGIVGYFGEYYFNEYKGDSVLELYLTIKGYSATEETVDLARKNDTLIGYSLDPVNNYYMYHYLVTSGEYIWTPAYWMFTPNHGEYSKEQILENNKATVPALENGNIGKTAGSWGSSMDSLEPIFTEANVDVDTKLKGDTVFVNFANEIKGDDADFMYVEFKGMDKKYQYALITQDEEFIQDVDDKSLSKYLMKKIYNPSMTVTISWDDDEGNSHNMSCKMDEGKLLLPLGAGKGWLFDSHSDVKIEVLENDKIIKSPEISKIRLLKLREVN